MKFSKRIFLSLLILIIASSNALLCQTVYEELIVGKHTDEAVGVFVNEGNTMVATCSLDETIKLWSLPDGKEIRTLQGHFGQVNNISFSGDDKKLASASADLTVRIWDVETGKELKVLEGHTDKVIGVYFSQEDTSSLVASSSFDGTVKLWDFDYGKEVKTLYSHHEPVNNVAYSYDGLYLASCSDDHTIKLWSTDLTTKVPLKTLSGHEAPVLTVLFSFDSRYLASSDQDGNIFIWQMPEGNLLRKIKAHSELVQDLSFTEKGYTIVSGSLDKSIKLWDVETGQNLMTKNIDSEVWSVDVVSDGSIIVAACADGTIRYFNKTTLAPKKEVKTKPAPKGKKGAKK